MFLISLDTKLIFFYLHKSLSELLSIFFVYLSVYIFIQHQMKFSTNTKSQTIVNNCLSQTGNNSLITFHKWVSLCSICFLSHHLLHKKQCHVLWTIHDSDTHLTPYHWFIVTKNGVNYAFLVPLCQTRGER